METIMRTRPLKNAFKRFQRLPELPVITISDKATTQSLGEALPPKDTEQAHGATEEQFWGVRATLV